MKNTLTKRWFLTALLLFAPLTLLWAQGPVRVTGQVVDANGPLIGASVVEKGTTNGTTTDVDGRYAISVAKDATLVFSFIGYDDQEQPAVNGTLHIRMTESAQAVDEVVVVGYGVQKKSSVTGAISQVKVEDIQNRTITNAQSALQGKTAGVQVIQTSAAPGSSPAVRVRGFSSNVGSSPLYVVDGVRLSDISGLDPNDIESMEVLKDAASAAIYGAEAGNGVVLISTKKGKAGEGIITYDFQYVTQSLGHMPKMLNSEQYIQYMSEAGTYDRDYLLKTWDGTTNTSWVDVAYGNSSMQKHNISMQNGNDRGNYYVSLSYVKNNGIVRGDADMYKRLTGVINAEYNIKKWMKVGTTNQIEKYDVRSVSESNEYGSMLTSVMLLDPLTPATYAPDQLPGHMLKAIADGRHLLTDADGNYYGVSQYYAGENYHPLIMRDNNLSKNGGFNVNGSVYADFKPFKGFTFTSRFGYRLSGSKSSSASLPFYGNVTQANDYLGYQASSSTSIYYQWENFANYVRSFDKHNINAMLGMSYQESSSNYVNGSLSANEEDALKKNDPLFYYLNYGAASATKGVGGEETVSSKLSYFGRVGYDYAGKYMVQFSLRADAADLSKLPSTSRWGYFPAVSAGWMMSEEKFFEPLRKTVNSLKVRASWGQNGSLAALGGYMYSTDMNGTGTYPFVIGNKYQNATAPTSMGNADLKWETSEQLDFGIDARLLNNRMTLSVDYFTKKTKDLLVSGTTPSLCVGGTSSPMNAGNVSNNGWEVELGWRDQVGDFHYSVRGNFATLNNKVTYIHPSITRLGGVNFHTSTITYFEQGYPVYYFRGYKFTGVNPENGEPMFADVDGDGVFDPDNDKTYIGDAIPDITYGLTLTAAWKGLDLTVFGTGAAGNKIFNCINRPDFAAVNKMKSVFYDNRWTAENPNGTVPRAGARDMQTYMYSDALVYDGSYFKIKQIQLGYTFPKHLLSKIRIQNLRIYCSLDDFFTFTKYPGFDPEVSANAMSGMGIDKGAYPASRKVVFGLNIGF